eukprot:6109673-Amphidinium_carterae.1
MRSQTRLQATQCPPLPQNAICAFTSLFHIIHGVRYSFASAEMWIWPDLASLAYFTNNKERLQRKEAQRSISTIATSVSPQQNHLYIGSGAA